MASGVVAFGRSPTARALVVGVGTPDRGDDVVGLLAADAVAALRLPGVVVHRLDGSPLGLLSLWDGGDDVVLIDAVRDRTAAPGTIRRMDVRHGARVGRRVGGAHDASLAQTIALARALDRLPRSLVLYGVVGRRFDVGRRPVPDVVAAVSAVAELVRGEVAATMSVRPGGRRTGAEPRS